MMKIAMIGPVPPFRGGISQFAAMLGDSYTKLGYTVRYFNFIKQYPPIIFPSGNQFDDSMPSIASERVLTPYKPWTWISSVKRIKLYNPDYVILSWWLPFFAPCYRYIIRRVSNAKIIVIVHNVLPHERWYGNRIFVKSVFDIADKIVLLSKSTLRDLESLFSDRYRLKSVLGFHPIYNCYGTQTYPKTTQPTILFFGLIKPYKGLDVLLRAMRPVLQSIPNLKLIIAGDVYGEKCVYENKIRDLGIESSVETHFRYIGSLEISTIFGRANVCILPYISASQSGVIATAFSFNMPIIASDVGGIGEYIEQYCTGLLVPPGDVESLALAIIQFFNESMGESMSKLIEAKKDTFSWKALSRIVIE